MNKGIPPLQAALRGAKEITFTVLSMSLSLVAVFIPILLMGGMVGRLFREFAVTLSVAIIVSLFVSLTTTPMMCARLLKPEQSTSHGWWYRVSERFFEGHARRLRDESGLGAAASAQHARRDAGDHGTQHLPLRHRSQRASFPSRTPVASAATSRPRRIFRFRP